MEKELTKLESELKSLIKDFEKTNKNKRTISCYY